MGPQDSGPLQRPAGQAPLLARQQQTLTGKPAFLDKPAQDVFSSACRNGYADHEEALESPEPADYAAATEKSYPEGCSKNAKGAEANAPNLIDECQSGNANSRGVPMPASPRWEDPSPAHGTVFYMGTRGA